MPWCPKCKNEYQDGYKVCTDCGCELVESMVDRSVMEDMVLCLLEEEDAKKCLDFLPFAKIDTAYISFEEDEDTYAGMAVSDTHLECQFPGTECFAGLCEPR